MTRQPLAHRQDETRQSPAPKRRRRPRRRSADGSSNMSDGCVPSPTRSPTFANSKRTGAARLDRAAPKTTLRPWLELPMRRLTPTRSSLRSRHASRFEPPRFMPSTHFLFATNQPGCPEVIRLTIIKRFEQRITRRRSKNFKPES